MVQAGQIRWATIDSPWVHSIDRGTYDRALAELRGIEPTMVCSSHLPPAPGGMLDLFVDSLAAVPDADPFTGPDQATLEAMLGAARRRPDLQVGGRPADGCGPPVPG